MRTYVSLPNHILDATVQHLHDQLTRLHAVNADLIKVAEMVIEFDGGTDSPMAHAARAALAKARSLTTEGLGL